MIKWTTLLIIVAVIVVAVIGIKMTISPSQSIPSTQSNTESAASANTDVREGLIEAEITNFAFVPAEIKVKLGSKVTWVNNDNSPHTVTSDSGGKSGLSSGTLEKGESYGKVFDSVGVFNYHCNFHSSMKGKVVVVE